MRIRSVSLRNFRNFDAIDIRCAPGFNLLLGGNAKGKTSFLESICILATGESYKAGTLKEVIRFGEEAAVIRSTVENGNSSFKLDFVVTSSGAKPLRVNGALYDRRKRGTPIPTVLFSPDHLSLIKGPPEVRRAFMDHLLSQLFPTYSYQRRVYAKAMKERNAALQNVACGRLNASIIDIYDEQLVSSGSEMVKQRATAIARISDMAAAAYGEMAGGEIRAQYVSQLYPSDQASLEQLFKKKLEERREAELAKGVTLVGPHRDDMCVTLNGHDMRSFASQGEQRTACLALKFAELSLLEESFHVKPVLLLDDVMSELDERRRRALMIKALAGGQVLVTSTNRDYFTSEELKSAEVIDLG